MALSPIPLKTPIVDAIGAINIFFLQRWEDLRTLIGLTPCKTIYSSGSTNAAIASQLLYTAVVGGFYRVTFTARRLAVDGAASSLTFTWHWTDGGAPFSKSATADTVDTTAELYSASQLVPVDVNTNLTFDMGYSSTTPGQMAYKVNVTVELLQQV